jgi:hypothetical protein
MALVGAIGVMMLLTPIMARVSDSGQHAQESNSEWFCFCLGLSGACTHALASIAAGSRHQTP